MELKVLEKDTIHSVHGYEVRKRTRSWSYRRIPRQEAGVQGDLKINEADGGAIPARHPRDHNNGIAALAERIDSAASCAEAVIAADETLIYPRQEKIRQVIPYFNAVISHCQDNINLSQWINPRTE
jgi:hypothetical protein